MLQPLAPPPAVCIPDPVQTLVPCHHQHQPRIKWKPELLCDSVVRRFMERLPGVDIYAHFRGVYRHFVCGELDGPWTEAATDRSDLWNQLMCAAIQFEHEALLDMMVANDNFPSQRVTDKLQLTKGNKPRLLKCAILHGNTRIVSEYLERYNKWTRAKDIHDPTETLLLNTEPATPRRGAPLDIRWTPVAAHQIETSMELAVRLDRLAIVQLLAPHFSAEETRSGQSVLHLAARHHARACFSWALHAAPELVTAYDAGRRLPVQLAAGSCDGDMVAELASRMLAVDGGGARLQEAIPAAVRAALLAWYPFGTPDTFRQADVLGRLWLLADGAAGGALQRAVPTLSRCLAETLQGNVYTAMRREDLPCENLLAFASETLDTTTLLSNMALAGQGPRAVGCVVGQLCSLLAQSILAFRQPLFSSWQVQLMMLEALIAMARRAVDTLRRCHQLRVRNHIALEDGDAADEQRLLSRPAVLVSGALEPQAPSDDLVYEYYGEEAFVTGEPLYLTQPALHDQMLTLFAECLLLSPWLGPGPTADLASYLTRRPEPVAPFVSVYLNGLEHEHWATATDSLMAALGEFPELGDEDKEVVRAFCNPRRLATLSRRCIQAILRHRGLLDHVNVARLPLPSALHLFILSLEE